MGESPEVISEDKPFRVCCGSMCRAHVIILGIYPLGVRCRRIRTFCLHKEQTKSGKQLLPLQKTPILGTQEELIIF